MVYYSHSGNMGRRSRNKSYRSKVGVIGMVSIKTIKTRTGRIVIKQGERISEETLREEEVLPEILANAMPGRTPGK